jgi:hypothetical protein
MPAESEGCADFSNSPSVEAVCALTSRDCESLTFEQMFDLYAPPVHVPELLDEPARELSFLRAGALRMGASSSHCRSGAPDVFAQGAEDESTSRTNV